MHHKQLTNASAEVAIVTELKSSWQNVSSGMTQSTNIVSAGVVTVVAKSSYGLYFHAS